MNRQATSTAAASTERTLLLPAGGYHVLSSPPGVDFVLSFDPGKATFDRSGNDLTIRGENGGTLVLNDFFVVKATGDALPRFVLSDGEVVDSADFLKDLNVDISTAAGPASAQSDSSGEGEYLDNAGDLLGGLERMGSMGTTYWDRGTEVPEYQAATTATAGGAADGAGTPDAPVGPVGPLAYIARGVMYTQNENTLPELQVDLLSVSGGSATKYADGSAPADASLVFFDENGDPIADPMGWNYVDGKIIFDNPPAAGGIFYVTITDGNGNTYSMQIVVTPDETFDSKAQDAATPPAGGELAHGEWHSGKDTDNAGGYETTSSNLNDEMTFTGDMVGGKINTGHATNHAWGDDSITVNGDVDASHMDFGTGRGRLDVNGGISTFTGGTSIKMAHGVINIINEKHGNVPVLAVNAMNHTDDVRAQLDILAGDADVNIKAGTNSYAYGMGTRNADVNVEAGTLNIEARGGTSASGLDAFYNSTVTLNADTVNIDSKSEGGYVKGILSSESTVGIAAHDVTIKTDGGQAVALRTQEGGDINIDATGKVDITAMGFNSTGSGFAYGMEINRDSTVNVKGGSVDIKASSDSFTRAVYGDQAEITLTSENTMNLKAFSTGSTSDAAGIEAMTKTTMKLAVGGKLDINATGGSKGYGILASRGSTVDITADSADIDASGKSALGIHATGNGSTVDITAKDVTVNAIGSTSTGWARGIQAWGGENNSVGIHSKGGEVSVSAYGVEGYAMSAEGTGNKTLIEGAEKVTLKASHTGMSASTGNAGNTIDGGAVHITVDGQGVSHSGMYAGEGKNIIQNASSVTIEALKGGTESTGVNAAYKGENTITSAGDVTIMVKDGTSKNYGLNAAAGSNKITSANGDVKITATGNAAENIAINATQGATTSVTAANGTVTLEATGSGFGKGINASGKSTVNIDAHDVTIKVDGKYASQGSNALRNDAGEITIHSNGGKVTLEAGGTVGWHAGMLAMSGGTSTIQGAKETVITVKDDGMSAAGGTNIIDGTGVAGDSVRITAGGAMYAVGMGLNKILSVDNVYMGSEAKRADTGMNVYNTGENSVENAKHVEIYAKSYGMITQGGYGVTAKNSITADDVTINVANAAADSNARGMYAKENTALNTISAKDVDISVSGTKSSVGMEAVNKGANTITSDGGTVNVTARGGESYGMYTRGGDTTSNPDQSKNLIQGASKVTVAADNIAMHSNRGTNTIKDITGKAGEKAVDIIADGASTDGRIGMYAANHQGNTFNTLSENRIEKVTGNVVVTASGGGDNNAGMYAYTYQQKSGEGVARNIITGVTGDVTVSALDGDTNYAMRAFAQTGSNPTENIIEDVSGTVTLKAAGGAESFAMSASGQNASNTISNAGGVDITATATDGGSSAYAMHAQDGGHNIIDSRLVVGEGPVGIILTAKGAAASYAMHASGAASINAIYGSETRDNNIELRGDIHAENGGKNILQTGAGDDHIVIDGKVTGNFQFNAGDGYDTLELRAASWDDFTARYGTWLEANFNSMSIENLQWVLGDSAGAVPGWLIDLVDSYNSLHPDAPLDVDYAALGIEPPVSESAHAGSADVHTEIAFVNAADSVSGHTNDILSADDAPLHASGVGDAGDANAVAHAAAGVSGHTADSGGGHANDIPPAGDASQHNAGFGTGGAGDMNAAAYVAGASGHVTDSAGGQANHALHADDTFRYADGIPGGDEPSEIHDDAADAAGIPHDGHSLPDVSGNTPDGVVAGDHGGDSAPTRDTLSENSAPDAGDDRGDPASLQGDSLDVGSGDDAPAQNGYTGDTPNGGTGSDVPELNLDVQDTTAFAAGGGFGVMLGAKALQGLGDLYFDLIGDPAGSLNLDGPSTPSQDGGDTRLYTGDAAGGGGQADVAWEAAGTILGENAGQTQEFGEDQTLLILIGHGL